MEKDKILMNAKSIAIVSWTATLFIVKLSNKFDYLSNVMDMIRPSPRLPSLNSSVEIEIQVW